jgi:hypothetical protein
MTQLLRAAKWREESGAGPALCLERAPQSTGRYRQDSSLTVSNARSPDLPAPRVRRSIRQPIVRGSERMPDDVPYELPIVR